MEFRSAGGNSKRFKEREERERDKNKEQSQIGNIGGVLSKRTLFLNFTMGVFKKWACLEKKGWAHLDFEVEYVI